MLKLNLLNHPICLETPSRLTPASAWHEHIPFAMFLVDVSRPKIIVELGTQSGDSYCAFCQAVKELYLDTLCYAIDTWQGDPHAGLYGPEVLADLRSHHDPLYGNFSCLIQSTFDEALAHFADETVDLLHIDGYHTYESVKHDFESWIPKISPSGLVLLHDTNVQEHDFGIRKFWDEIKSKYPHFEFLHGHGLGILAIGRIRSPELKQLFQLSEENSNTVREFFFHLGQRLTTKVRTEVRDAEFNNTLQAKDNQIAELTNGLQSKDNQIAELNTALHAKDAWLQQIQHGIVMQLVNRYQRVVEKLLRSGTRRRGVYELGLAGIRVMLNEGWRSFWFKLKIWRRRRKNLPANFAQQIDPYQLWIIQNEPNAKELERQRQESLTFPYRPKISIITPVWNTDKKWLKLAIESALNQTYANWELCLADGNSTKPHIKEILQDYAKKDPRIKVKFLAENKGIAGNANEALSLATGEFIGLLDHDDELAPLALYEVVKLLNERPEADFIYSDEDKVTNEGRRFDPYFKPDWSPDMFLSSMYTCHFGLYRKSIIDKLGGFRIGYDGAQDWDLVLRFIEKAKRIQHIPKVLYHWRSHPNSIASTMNSKPYALAAGKRSLSDYLVRNNIRGEVIDGPWASSYRVKREIMGNPLISIIIPTRDNGAILKRCISTILEKTDYPNYEVLIVDNQSIASETLDYFAEIEKHPKIRIIQYDRPFNFSAINNYAASQANGEYILFLNNDTEVITREWIRAMLEHAQRQEVGAVGAKLLFPDGSIQHCGIILGMGYSKGQQIGTAGHIYSGSQDHNGYFDRVNMICNYSAVTAACMMLRKNIFEEVGGFDENLSVAFGDVDLCLKIRERGYLIVYTPYAKLYHHESYSGGYEDTPEKQARFLKETEYMRTRWGHVIDKGDPYYNPNLSLESPGFTILAYRPQVSQALEEANISRKRPFTFVTYQDLMTWTLDWATSIPHSYDVIVGVPRSGLLVASIIALRLGKPLTTPDNLLQQRCWTSEKISTGQKISKNSRVLLVEDSVASGKALSYTLQSLRSVAGLDITVAALITTPEARKLVDLNYTVIPVPYHFEWSLTHQRGNGISKVAMDLDGVLCEDCPLHIDMDDDLYANWVRNVKSKFVPLYTIDVIVSNRLEKYRSFTQEWLSRNGISYNKLCLWDVQSKEERGGIEKWVKHKIEVLSAEKPDLMIESDREQAERIWKATGIPVLWYDGKEIIQEG